MGGGYFFFFFSGISISSAPSSLQSSDKFAYSTLPYALPKSVFQTITDLSLPPTEIKKLSSLVNLTLITCDEWPIYSFLFYFGTTTG